MSFISILRLIVLNLCSVFGLAILGITAHLTALTTPSSTGDPIFFDFEGLGLVTGSLSTIAIFTMLVHGATRNNSFASMIVVELCVLGLIWILWLANAAVVVEWTQLLYPDGCGVFFSHSIEFTVCQELFAIEGLSFSSWLLLMIYTGILLVLSLMGRSRGNPIWTVSVNQANFSAPSGEREVATGASVQQPSANNIGSVNSPYSAGNIPMHGSQQFQYPPGTSSSSGIPQASVPMQQTSYTALMGQQQHPQHPQYPQV
ncbi:hypothetical protein BD779DRAFT_559794 [Infundibulicybe gibba]|nr:hypothetical protein BD779DRAFT_559794 [Infundibulicybe gibba]